jgi:hypothetical protein
MLILDNKISLDLGFAYMESKEINKLRENGRVF